MDNMTAVRGIRGATTVGVNSPEEIYSATRELLNELVRVNSIETRDIASVIFSATPDVNSAFPARAAREIGWVEVPLFCSVEIDVPGSMPCCIRVLILLNTTAGQDQVKHLYLRGTEKLREQ